MDDESDTISGPVKDGWLDFWPLQLASVFVGGVFFATLFLPVESSGRWLAYIAVALIAVSNALSPFFQKRLEPGVTFRGDSVLNFASATSAVVILAVAIVLYFTLPPPTETIAPGIRLLGSAAVILISTLLGFVAMTGFWWIRRLNSFGIIFIGSATLLVVMSLLRTRTGAAVNALLKSDPLVLLALASLLGVAMGLVAAKVTQSRHTRFEWFRKWVPFTLLAVVSLVLAFRSDSIFSIPGARFHWSYFTGVIDTLNSGGTLLWDTPSQYGIGPVLIPALMSASDSVQAFFLFQGLLMTLTCAAVLLALKFLSQRPSQFVLLGSLWVIIFFFADPSLIGPQPYPSSSAIRFGPSLLLLSFLLVSLVKKTGTQRGITFSWSFALLSGLAFWWSAESSVYTIAIIGAYFTSSIIYNSSPGTGSRYLVRILAIPAIGILAGGLLAAIVVLIRTHHIPDFSMFWMYSGGYAQGFGGYPFELSSPVWILLLVIGLLSVGFVVKRNPINSQIAVILLGAVGGWFTYYVGRAVPDNVVAMYPLIAFVLFIAVALIPLRTLNNESLHKSEFLYTALLASTAMVFATLIVVTPLVKIFTPGWLSSIKVSTTAALWNGEAVASPALVNSLNQIPQKLQGLPIAFEGYNGVLPQTTDLMSWKANDSKTWLPKPLGLLEEPITNVKQSQIVSRFIQDVPSDGLFIWDKKNSFPDRAATWKALISQSHNCSQITSDANYEILHCTVK